MPTRKISEFPAITPAPSNRILLENPGGAPTTSDGIGQTTLQDAVRAAGLLLSNLADVSITSTPPSGSLLVWNGTAWTAQSPSGAGALTYFVDTMTADVTLGSSNTWYNAISRNLAAGTWLIVAQIGFWRTATGARTYYARIVAGSTTVSNAQAYMPSANPSGITITLVAVATGMQTITLQGATSNGSTSEAIRATGALDMSPWTRMAYLKIG